MEFVAEEEGTPGGGPPRVLEGTRPSPASRGEGARDLAGIQETDVGQERDGSPGLKKTEEAEGIQIDLTVVKQEVVDWSYVDGCLLDGRRIKQEVEDGPDMKDEQAGILQVKQEVDSSVVVKEEKVDEPEVKVKEEVMDWVDVKEQDQQGNLKQELFFHQTVKEEPMVDGVDVKDEKNFLKTEAVEDRKVKEELQMGPPVGSKRKLALSRCETCGTEEAKYRCPRCMRYSCSLPCVKRHKAELTCNGVRDKTAYVSIQHFTEMNLLSDYRFLEDVARTADHISRDTSLRRPTSNKHMYFMKYCARRQGINLKLLPNGFTKRKENSTYFDRRKRQFFWHVKLQFPQSQAEYVEKRVPDDKTINEILKPYVDPEQSDPVIRQRLKAYVRSHTGVQILMKAENMQQNFIRYHELDPYKSLLDNLKSKVIIEYPTLHVVLKGSCSDLKVLHQVKSEPTENSGSEH